MVLVIAGAMPKASLTIIGGRVVATRPHGQLRFMIGWNVDEAKKYIEERGWQWRKV